jgi:hypothetical protein
MEHADHSAERIPGSPLDTLQHNVTMKNSFLISSLLALCCGHALAATGSVAAAPECGAQAAKATDLVGSYVYAALPTFWISPKETTEKTSEWHARIDAEWKKYDDAGAAKMGGKTFKVIVPLTGIDLSYNADAERLTIKYSPAKPRRLEDPRKHPIAVTQVETLDGGGRTSTSTLGAGPSSVKVTQESTSFIGLALIGAKFQSPYMNGKDFSVKLAPAAMRQLDGKLGLLVVGEAVSPWYSFSSVGDSGLGGGGIVQSNRHSDHIWAKSICAAIVNTATMETVARLN